MNKPHYRADIDGLRAVAVISVLLFHYGVDAFSGGFVGVDVFFVISGFLITRLIKNELEAGSFSLAHFYLRRARRLFPALFVIFLVCFAFAFHVFSALHFERFGGALLYAILSISNIFFWNEQGYFDTAADFKPLLHTWSLSVEEQFYLIWPTLLILLLSVKHRLFTPLMIGLIGVVSLYAAEINLKIDPNAIFFLTPFRIIEFSIGALTVWLAAHKFKYVFIEELILVVGLLLIGIAVVTFDNHIQFPGINALVPCLGAALVIYAGRAPFSGKLLSNPVTVRIGLISYSVYLIHWPLYVFYQYPTSHTLSNTEIIVLLLATLLLATVMYRYVETPFRQLKIANHQISNTGFAVACTLMALITTFPASHVWKYEGWPWRNQNQQNAVKNGDSNYKSEMEKRFVYTQINQACINTLSANCTSDKTLDGLVVGDSHAVDGYNALTIASKGKHQLSMLSLSACEPVVNPDQQIPARWPMRRKCLEINKRWHNPNTYAGFDYLVISSLFGGYFRSAELREYLQFIQSQTQIKHVIVFGNYIRLTQPLHSVIKKSDRLLETILKFKVTAFFENAKLKNICQEMQCLFIDKKELLCNNDDINSCKLVHNNIPFTWDKHHLSLEFSTLLGKLASEKINRYLDSNSVY